MLPAITRFIRSWTGKVSIVIIFVLLLGSFIVFKFLTRDTPQNNDIELEAGLVPIQIIQEKDGKEQEINFTETTLDILSSSINSTDNNSFVEDAKKGIQDANITKILFPAIPKNKVNIRYKSSNPQLAIEKYLQEVYTIFRDNKIEPNIVKLEAEALNQKTDTILSLLKTNTVLYKSLFYIDVPVEAIDLHINYIRLAQIQNSFLLSLLSATEDPVKLQINSNLTIRLLQQLDIPIKEKLLYLQDTYKITYREK